MAEVKGPGSARQPIEDVEAITPNTRDVRGDYAGGHPFTKLDRSEWFARFDRWLAVHDATVRAATLEEAAQIAEKVYPLGSQVLGDAPGRIAAAIRVEGGRLVAEIGEDK